MEDAFSKFGASLAALVSRMPHAVPADALLTLVAQAGFAMCGLHANLRVGRGRETAITRRAQAGSIQRVAIAFAAPVLVCSFRFAVIAIPSVVGIPAVSIAACATLSIVAGMREYNACPCSAVKPSDSGAPGAGAGELIQIHAALLLPYAHRAYHAQLLLPCTLSGFGFVEFEDRRDAEDAVRIWHGMLIVAYMLPATALPLLL